MQNDKTTVCVLTARGMAAISSIALSGVDAREILGRVFRASKNTAKQSLTMPPNMLTEIHKTCRLEAGGTIHGSIVDGERVIDGVVVGCEGVDHFVIHCHGNPLLVEQIVKLLQSHGAELADAESFAYSKYKAVSETTIEAEAKLAMQQSATLLGVKILQSQIDGGLSKWAQDVLENIDSLNTEEIKRQCSDIVERSQIANRIIEGVRIVIAGPPNSGKSTLLNCLAGTEQVIVSDTAGTTRDWISVHCDLGPIRAEFIDTAGLDDVLACKDSIEQVAQEITKKLLDSCDLVLCVQDIIEFRIQNSELRIDVEQPILYVNNKSDLLRSQVPGLKSLCISAKDNIGIDSLVQTILDMLGVGDFDFTEPIAFTQRQLELLSKVIGSRHSIEDVFGELINSYK